MSSSSQEQSPPPSKSPTMEVDQQNQPQLMASVTTQNLDDTTPTNHHQQVEEEEEQAFTTAPNNVNWLENEFFDIGTDIGDIDCFNLPPGYRFCPYDDELVVHYLKKKVMNQPLPHNMIKDVKLYDYNPDFLTGLHPYVGEKQWYFFTPRDRKYRNGNRPNRAAGNGYWKATGADKTIKFEGVPVGFRKALVFYLGRPPKGEKTSWIMHEFRVDGPPRTRRDPSDMKLDDWVLCRIYKKAEKLNRAEEPDQLEAPGGYSSALSEENSPRVNENDIAEMNCDYNDIGDSKGLMKTYGGCLQSPFQMGFPEIPRFTDSLPHFGKLSVHYPTLSINYGAQPVGFGTPDLVHSTNSIFGSKYLKEHGLDSKPRVFHEDIWSNTDLDNCDLDLDYDFSCSNDDMDLGNILPDNAQT